MSEKFKWSSENDQFLIENFKTKGRSFCAEQLKICNDLISDRAKILGIARQSPRIWTEEEDNIIRENYFEKGIEFCITSLKRSKTLINKRRLELGIKNFERVLWEQKDDDFIKENYLKISTEELAKVLGRSIGSIHARALKLDVVMHGKYRWFEGSEEMNFLRENYPTKGSDFCAKVLGETSHYIARVARENNIKKNPRYQEGYYICRVCEREMTLDSFHKNSFSSTDYHTTCKECNKIDRDTNITTRKRKWSSSTLFGHRRNGFVVNITTDEIYKYVKDVENCPLCLKQVNWFNNITSSNSPTIDRINNEKFLNKDNVGLLCHKCNVTKSYRTPQQLLDYANKVLPTIELICNNPKT